LASHKSQPRIRGNPDEARAYLQKWKKLPAIEHKNLKASAVSCGETNVEELGKGPDRRRNNVKTLT
jgi:hypothetical protein